MKFSRLVNLIKKVFRYYPLEQAARPETFNFIEDGKLEGSRKFTVCFQLVPDLYYFLIFGGIWQELTKRIKIHASVLVVQSISGTIGFNWKTEVLRLGLFAWLRTVPWVRAYGKLDSGNIGYRSSSFLHPIQDIISLYQAYQLWKNVDLTLANGLTLEFQGIQIGDLVTDSYLRFRPSPKFEINDLFTLKIIWQAIRDIKNASNYFKKYRPDVYLTSYSTYLEHGIAVRVALQNNISTWSFGSLINFSKRLTGTDFFHTPNCSGYRHQFAKLDNQQNKLKEAEYLLLQRFSGKIDVATQYMKQSAYQQTKLDFQLTESSVVIFLHDFYDSPHSWSNFIFTDFWNWLIFTIEVLEKFNIPYYIKQHPNQINLSQSVIKDLQKIINQDHWLPLNMSTTQLIEAKIQCGITVYGTIAHELAYFGIHSICCAQHPHHSFNFCKTAKNIDDYKRFIINYMMPPCSKQQMQEESLAFYYMHNLLRDDSELEFLSKHHALWHCCENSSTELADIRKVFQELINHAKFQNFCDQMISEISN